MTHTRAKIATEGLRFPPDAQVEISKRDKWIKELEEALVGYKADQAELIALDVEQAAEIARLNGVIVKCACSLHAITKRANYLDVLDIAREANEALAAIKEEGL